MEMQNLEYAPYPPRPFEEIIPALRRKISPRKDNISIKSYLSGVEFIT